MKIIKNVFILLFPGGSQIQKVKIGTSSLFKNAF
jgi:hypothetical protein